MGMSLSRDKAACFAEDSMPLLFTLDTYWFIPTGK